MKICLVPTMFPKYKGDYYGSFIFDDAKMLVNKGFEVHVVTQHNTGIPYEEIMDGIHVHRFRWMKPKKFKALVHFKGLIDNFRLVTYLISLFFNLMWIIKKLDIDIIHAHSVVPTGLIGVIVANIVRKPVFITVHGMDITNFENNPFFKRLIRFSLNNCNKAVAVSMDLSEKMEKLEIKEDKIIVLRNAIDTKRFIPLKNRKIRNYYGVNDKDILILFVGYLDTFKGVFELMNSFHEINKKNVNVKLMIVGEGPKNNELKKIASRLCLETHVIFAGKISPSDIHEYYQSSDIFVLPSHTEGTPLVVIEAMACGLPIVASNVGGIPEIVINNKNGFIITPQNEIELISKVQILVKNQSLRNKFADKSIEIINTEFDNDIKVEKLINLYKNAAGR
ncbi:MAG: glycosyltransferase [Methanobacterium sp.]|uniref:glycosyltransferase n=1 Tax=Methanobacterium sp. TaxID=2164 RepID=UPI003D64E1F7|nr:glycosyltransferase [Methanobacterium sp.]